MKGLYLLVWFQIAVVVVTVVVVVVTTAHGTTRPTEGRGEREGRREENNNNNNNNNRNNGSHRTTLHDEKVHEDKNVIVLNLGDRRNGGGGGRFVVDLRTGTASIHLLPRDSRHTAPPSSHDQRRHDPWVIPLSSDMWVAGWTQQHQHPHSMSLVSSHVVPDHSLNHPLFGPYSKVTLVWSVDSASPSTPTTTATTTSMRILETSYLVFSDYEMILFDQYFPNGWIKPPPSEGPLPTLVSPFPSINLSLIASDCHKDDDDESSLPCVGYLLWGDCFLSDTRSGNWDDLDQSNPDQSWGVLFDGDTHGQPWVLHDDTGRTAVWSSLTNFFVSGAAMDPFTNTTLGWGLRTTLDSIPHDFHHSSIMVAGYGINAT